MTSGADPDVIAAARAKGALGPIAKPFRAVDLAARIQVAIRETFGPRSPSCVYCIVSSPSLPGGS